MVGGRQQHAHAAHLDLVHASENQERDCWTGLAGEKNDVILLLLNAVGIEGLEADAIRLFLAQNLTVTQLELRRFLLLMLLLLSLLLEWLPALELWLWES